MKVLFWVGRSFDDLRGFPPRAKHLAGLELFLVQRHPVDIRAGRGGPVMKTSIKRSSGNVFVDLGFDAEEAEHLRIRASMMAELRRVIETRGLTQVDAAKLFHVTQPRVSNLVRGRIDLFSIDTLVEMLSRAGVRIQLVMSPGKKKRIA